MLSNVSGLICVVIGLMSGPRHHTQNHWFKLREVGLRKCNFDWILIGCQTLICVHWTFQVALFISLKSAIMSLAKIDNRNFLLKMPVNKNYKNGWPGVGLWTFVCILDNFSQIDHITSKHHVHGTCCCPKNDVHFITSALVYNVSSWGKEDIQDVDGLIGLYLRKSIGFT